MPQTRYGNSWPPGQIDQYEVREGLPVIFTSPAEGSLITTTYLVESGNPVIWGGRASTEQMFTSVSYPYYLAWLDVFPDLEVVRNLSNPVSRIILFEVRKR